MKRGSYPIPDSAELLYQAEGYPEKVIGLRYLGYVYLDKGRFYVVCVSEQTYDWDMNIQISLAYSLDDGKAIVKQFCKIPEDLRRRS